VLRPGALERRKLLAAMKLDKKVSEGEVKFVLARAIGKVAYGQRVPEALVNAVLRGEPKDPHGPPARD
jgi:3-dehydroquinate synthetase